MPSNDEIAIDENVPIPDFTRKPGRRPMYPFDKMKVGDSFLIPEGKEDSVRAQARRRNRETTKEFRSLTTDEGTRIWRIK